MDEVNSDNELRNAATTFLVPDCTGKPSLIAVAGTHHFDVLGLVYHLVFRRPRLVVLFMRLGPSIYIFLVPVLGEILSQGLLVLSRVGHSGCVVHVGRFNKLRVLMVYAIALVAGL